MKFITVNGLSRSGNHAIIRWMCGNYEKEGYKVYFQNNAIKNLLEYINLRGGGGLAGIPANPRIFEIMMHLTKNEKKVFIVSFEDLLIDKRLGELSDFSDHNVIILRDPYNLFASRIQGLTPPRGRKGWTNSHPPKNIQNEEIKKYLSHYEEFSKNTNYLSNKICINYNLWVSDKEYRKKIVESDLRIKFTDARYEQRACSSFGPKAPIELPSNAPEDFVTRYKACSGDPMFESIKNDKDLASIAKETFGIEIK
jgi:hypothetical protein